ncbi:MAG: Na/Pi cotransporter family protein [Clostridia bacterium]|nr:Na/Pi cotransporter family protein [Clostridia bacterium]
MGILLGIFTLLTGVGVFIAGMNMMGDGLEKSAGGGLKKLLAKISNNRFAGVGIGATVTGIIQSSSATSVMVIGLVNAGVMTLFQATSIIMGANIGTTVTGLIVALSGSDGGGTSIGFSEIAMLLAFIGIMMTFFKNEKVKKIGGILGGLGLIFVGLDIMGGALKGNPELNSFFTTLFEKINFPLLLIILGALFTALIQSSSAATGIVITMAGAGVIDVNLALYIVLGSNIGTCVTALIACIGASANSKRTAFIHFTFNTIGTIIFTSFLWPSDPWFANLLATLFGKENYELQIAMFHVIFNVVTTIILVPFIKQLVDLSIVVIKDKKFDEENRQLKFVDERLLKTPAVAVMQVKKEVEYMASLAKENLGRAFEEMQNKDGKNKTELYQVESTINFTNNAMTKYLIQLSPLLNSRDEQVIGSYFHVLNDLERIGDHAENFFEIGSQMGAEELSFSDMAFGEIMEMYRKVDRMFEIAIEAFDNVSAEHLKELTELENEVDGLKKKLSSQHFTRLATGACKVEQSAYFFSTVAGLERVADHLINIGYSILTPTGDQKYSKIKA